MNKLDVQQICQGVTSYIYDNSATILTILGSAGVVTTAIMSSKAVPKAQLLLEQKESFKMDEYGEQLTRFERMLAVMPAYIPTILMGAGTITCILGANHINKQQQAALYSAYAYLSCSFGEYKEKVKELFGEDKEREIRAAIAKDKKVEIHEKLEDSLTLYDEWGQRYFTITKDKYQRAIYEINKMYNFTGEMTLNNLYEFFDLDPIPGGDFLGWSALKDFECCGVAWINIKLTPLEMVDDHEVYVLEFNIDPSNDFAYWTTNDFC